VSEYDRAVSILRRARHTRGCCATKIKRDIYNPEIVINSAAMLGDSPYFMEPDDSLTHLQDPATDGGVL